MIEKPENQRTCEHTLGGLLSRQPCIGFFYLESDFRLRLVLFLVPWREHGAWEENLYVDVVELEFEAESVGKATKGMLCRRVRGITNQGHVSKS